MPKIISMKQLREHFAPIKKGLRRGNSYLLMYRSKPLATLAPYQEKIKKPLVNDNQNLLRHKQQKHVFIEHPKQPAKKMPYKQSSPNLQTKFTPNSVASTHNLIAETRSNFADRNPTLPSLDKISASATGVTTSIATRKPKTDLNKIKKMLAP